MQLVHSKADIEAIRPYKEHYKLTKWPKRFPAFVEFVEHDGGLGGDYYTMSILEIPAGVADHASFIAGVRAKPKKFYEEIFKAKKKS